MKTAEFLSLLAMTKYAESQNLKHCGFLQIGIKECVRMGMVPSKKLEYLSYGAIRHIHKVLQNFLYSRTSTQRLPQGQSKRTRYDKSGKCEIFLSMKRTILREKVYNT